MTMHRATSGTELLDWQEVWCFRCKHDHNMTHVETGDGCEIMARGLFSDDKSQPEWIDSGYVIRYRDEDGDHHEHVIPDVCNSLPAATFCTAFELCEEACRRHVNGAVIVSLTRANPQRDEAQTGRQGSEGL